MTNGSEQNETAGELRGIQREGESRNAGERMADDDSFGDAVTRKSGADEFGLQGRRRGAPSENSRAPAMPGTINGKDSKAQRGQRPGEGDHHVGVIAGGAVQQKRHAALRARRRRFDDMNNVSLDCDEIAVRREPFLDPARVDLREKAERCEQGQERKDSRRRRRNRRHRSCPWTALVSRSTLFFSDSSCGAISSARR